MSVSEQIESIEAAIRVLREERRAHVDAAEAKAKTDKKGRGEIDSAIADAVKRTTEPMENLENQYLVPLNLHHDLFSLV